MPAWTTVAEGIFWAPARFFKETNRLSLTYLGHSAVHFEVAGLNIYIDPYLKDPVDWRKLPKGDLVIYSHGHFDHGVLMAAKLYEQWGCQFLAPRTLTNWMQRKYHIRRLNAIQPGGMYAGINGFRMFIFAESTKATFCTLVVDYTISALLSVPVEKLL